MARPGHVGPVTQTREAFSIGKIVPSRLSDVIAVIDGTSKDHTLEGVSVGGEINAKDIPQPFADLGDYAKGQLALKVPAGAVMVADYTSTFIPIVDESLDGSREEHRVLYHASGTAIFNP